MSTGERTSEALTSTPAEERAWTDLEIETLVRLLGSGWDDLRIIAVGLGRTPAEVQRQCERLQLKVH